MTCVVCLEDGAGYVCECSAFHINCFAHFLARGHAECNICAGRFDRHLKAAALAFLCTRTSNTLGSAHHTTMTRKLEMAVALADIGLVSLAQRCLRDLISKTAGPVWIHSVSQVELARITYHDGQFVAASLILEDLLPKLVCINKRWSWLEHLESCTILGSCYFKMGRFTDAENLLLFVIGSYLEDRNACSRKVCKCMQEIANFCHSRNDFALACETHRVAVRIVEAEEIDPSRIALANLELARAELRAGDSALATVRFRTSIRTLRKRKHDTYARDALPDARKQLANLVKPSKRLRVKTWPEDC